MDTAATVKMRSTTLTMGKKASWAAQRRKVNVAAAFSGAIGCEPHSFGEHSGTRPSVEIGPAPSGFYDWLEELLRFQIIESHWFMLCSIPLEAGFRFAPLQLLYQGVVWG